MSRRKATRNAPKGEGQQDAPAGSDSTPATRNGKESTGRTGAVAGAAAAVRTRVAQVVWLLFVVCALLLAVGALLVALDANTDNRLVGFVLDGADAVDLGVFSRDNGIKQFRGDGAGVKNALLNWGLGAVAYLVVGRVLDRVIRP